MITETLLSILIPTTPERKQNVAELVSLINEQYYMRHESWGDIGGVTFFRHHDLLSPIEILIFEDNKEMTIGQKREMLYRHSLGKYSWQIDSDDTIAKDAIKLVLSSIHKDADCITFREHCVMDGRHYTSNHSLKYEKWQDNFDGFDFVRCPFYKDVIKTEIAKSIPFPHIRWNEDEIWSLRLRLNLQTEIHIDEELYYYQYTSTEFNERYGIK